MGNQHTKYDEKIKNFTIEKKLQDHEITQMKQKIQTQQEKLDKLASDIETLNYEMDIKLTTTVNTKASEDHTLFKVMIDEAIQPLEELLLKMQEDLKSLSKQNEDIAKSISSPTKSSPTKSNNVFSCLMKH